jgi:hypothetical protein
MVKNFVIGIDHLLNGLGGGVRNSYIILVGDLVKNSHMEDGAVGGGYDNKC